MKIDRLIGILSILLQKETVTAPYLADKFEVSRRTINRDVETLCQSGIPIRTKQGANGGISISPNYKIDCTLLSTNEMQDILAGLRSLDSVHKTNQYEQLMEKLSAGSSDFMTGNQSILIDLSSWDKGEISHKISIIRMAIDSCRKLSFVYYSPKGEQQRTVEPYFLIFHWSSWYLWGYCEKRQDFRLFKLNRMTELKTNDLFEKRFAPLPDLKNENIFSGGISVKAIFDQSCKWRLVEEFGENSFVTKDDGRLLLQTDFTNKENLLSWLMTFGDSVTLIEPKEIRAEIVSLLKRMEKNYNGGE